MKAIKALLSCCTVYYAVQGGSFMSIDETLVCEIWDFILNLNLGTLWSVKMFIADNHFQAGGKHQL